MNKLFVTVMAMVMAIQLSRVCIRVDRKYCEMYWSFSGPILFGISRTGEDAAPVQRVHPAGESLDRMFQ